MKDQSKQPPGANPAARSGNSLSMPGSPPDPATATGAVGSTGGSSQMGPAGNLGIAPGAGSGGTNTATDPATNPGMEMGPAGNLGIAPGATPMPKPGATGNIDYSNLHRTQQAGGSLLPTGDWANGATPTPAATPATPPGPTTTLDGAGNVVPVTMLPQYAALRAAQGLDENGHSQGYTPPAPAAQTPAAAPEGAPGGGGQQPPNTISNEWGSILGKLDLSNLPKMVSGDALQGTMGDARDAAYKQASGYLDPQWQNQQSALESKLANQGIPQNSEAWNKAMDDFGRQKEFAYGQARDASMNQGLAAQGQLFNQGLQTNQNQFGQDLSAAGFVNSGQNQMATQGLQSRQIAAQLQAAKEGAAAQLGAAGSAASASMSNVQAQLAAQNQQNQFNNSLTMHNQGINELLLQQQNPLSLYNSLNQGTGATQPNFTSTPGTGVNPTDIASMIANNYQGQLSGYNAQTGNANSNNAAMASIIAAIICDRRLKVNVRCIGRHEVGVPLYEFDYVWGEHGIGVMADELEEVMPEAVLTLPNGFKYVNMARL